MNTILYNLSFIIIGSILTNYGILGKHYNLTTDGKVDMTGFDPAVTGFAPDLLQPWGWNNSKFYRDMKDAWAGYNNIQKELSAYVTPNLTDAFVPNNDAIKAELAAVTQVKLQYQGPLDAGLLPNVDAGLATLKEKMKSAGIDQIKAEIEKQWIAYLDEKGIK